MAQRMSVGKTLFSEEQIHRRVRELGDAINEDYAGKSVLVLGVLKGCYVFIADLMRRLNMDVELNFIRAFSYLGTESTGKVEISSKQELDLEGKHVLLVEDIVDTGNTLTALVELFKSKNPASVKVCALLSKPSRRQVEFEADYTGFEIPDRFIVGYGLDCDEKFRQLPYIAELEIFQAD